MQCSSNFHPQTTLITSELGYNYWPNQQQSGSPNHHIKLPFWEMDNFGQPKIKIWQKSNSKSNNQHSLSVIIGVKVMIGLMTVPNMNHIYGTFLWAIEQ